MRENTKALQSQLIDAQATLTLRKEYDVLAEKITENRLLKPREEQASNLQKLREEIQDLEREKQAYEVTWHERREQFEKIVEQGTQLRRLIRDEKEEAERMEGLLGEDEGEGSAPDSRDATPLPITQTGSSSPSITRKGSPTLGNTPSQSDGMLGVEINVSRPREKSPLRNVQDAKAPMVEAEQKLAEEDTEMAEDGEVTAAPAPVEGLVAEGSTRALNDQATAREPGENGEATVRDVMDTA